MNSATGLTLAQKEKSSGNSLIAKIGRFLVPAGPSVPELPALRSLRLKENPQHPTIVLFEKRQAAQECARLMGAPWVAVPYACGYVLCDGWSFHDAKTPLPAFCMVPPDALVVIKNLVIDLKIECVPPRELPALIAASLRKEPTLAGATDAFFEGVCLITLMRVGYAMPTGAKDDWLTMPAWALRLPSRQKRLA